MSQKDIDFKTFLNQNNHLDLLYVNLTLYKNVI